MIDQQQQPAVVVDTKQETILMFKHYMASKFGNKVPLHLSEPFNIDVEYGMFSYSGTSQKYDLLNKRHEVIDSIMIDSIVNVEVNVSPPSTPRGGGTISRANGAQISGEATPTRSNNKASHLLGMFDPTPMSPSTPSSNNTSRPSKANILLGLDSAPSSPSTSSSSSSGKKSKQHTGLGTFTRSDSKTNLREMTGYGSIGVGSGSMLSQSMGMGMSGGGTSSPRSLESSPTLYSSQYQQLQQQQSGHYQYILMVSTKTHNYSFNVQKKEDTIQLGDTLRILSMSNCNALSDELQTTVNSVSESLSLMYKCRAPPIPALPHTPPPLPPHLRSKLTTMSSSTPC
ncbi:hypothetical protein SAMD00019534_088810 [Acytostelium subglobosum LB1]|uniref:hypothetical protein n=1 Tax=Acytostelium subglobosum LB1 TaxID=1410327 RepID=UPI000644C945|nr:hypothetical protein SAMD00019534_088810 [Acytostelium subglobosum LB1]GAM25706.1 hypothetical protein SAMD00019534_088810 [Acytostelium subglobosum LB1]|eukprot:XP_012751224.1 hypothetical protein SAMD00019534_088810 [Acytostelium subglobosum LB1]